MAPASSSASSALASIIERSGLWPIRVLWFLLPIVVGPGLRAAIDSFDGSGSAIVEIGLWAGWFVGLVATLTPSAISLTALRMISPGVLGVSLVAGLATARWPASLVIGITYGALVMVASFLPIVGDRMVNGSAYGSERRMTLRPPAFVLLGPVQLAWALAFACVVGAVWLLADERWILGAIGAAVAVGATWSAGRSLHQLSRRWLVFVPAGFVIHDHVIPVESILLRRSSVRSLGPATDPLDESTVDLSGGARGLVLETRLSEPVAFGLRAKGEVRATEATRLAFAPTLPGAVLREARIRAIKIGIDETA